MQKTAADGQAWRYAWNGAGQLTAVTLPSGYVAFAYNALGRRLSKRYRGRVTRWVWDGDVPLHEWTELEVGPGAGQADSLATWLFEENSFAPAAKLTAQGSYSVVTDHLGTPLELYDGTGQKTWQAQLDSYGAVRQGLGRAQDCPFRYQGQYEDVETGLYYNRFRYYDPEAGQYISQDPIGLEGGGSLYGYVQNPNGWLDVLGLACSRQKPRMEHGNEKEGWQHIDERHVSGNSAKGPGDLFAPGTTRAQLGQAANKVVTKGRRVTNDANRRMQTFEKKMVVNGRKDIRPVIN